MTEDIKTTNPLAPISNAEPVIVDIQPNKPYCGGSRMCSVLIAGLCIVAVVMLGYWGSRKA